MRKEFERLKKEYIKILPKSCCNCGATENLHFHHIVPIKLGGTNNITNIATVCAECHANIHGLNLLRAARPKGPRGLQANSRIKKIPDVLNEIISEKGFATRTELVEHLGYTSEHTLTQNWIRHKDYLDGELNRLGIVQTKDPIDKRFTIFVREQPGA